MTPPVLRPESIPAPSSAAARENFGGRTMIATPSGMLVSFGADADAEKPNEVSERALALADGSRSIREISEAICAEFDVTLPEAERDLTAFFKALTDVGAFEISS